MKDDLANNLRIFFENHGIDPVYAVTLFTVVIMLSYRKQVQNWDKQEGWQKGIIISTAFSAGIFLIISFLKLTGIIKL